MSESLDFLDLSPEEGRLVEALRRSMVEEIERAGAIRSERWREVFAKVPRHPFMSQFFARTDDGFLRPVDGSRQEQREEWLRAAYEITSWTTQIDAQSFADFSSEEEISGEPTSSTTQPDVMSAMLEALRIRDGHRVLEIGTGPGYNAALLSERLASENVVTVEVDADLALAAKERLAWCGYTPTVVVGDGLRGHREGVPYDRVIATASVPVVPLAWVEQTREGGLILANLSGGMNGGGLVLLTVQEPQLAEGRFLSDTVAFFMPVRSARVSGTERMRLLEEAERLQALKRPTALGPQVLEISDFDFLARLALQGATRIDVGTDDGWTLWLLDPQDGSAAAVTVTASGKAVVAETGPRGLWTTVEDAHALWERTGRPGRERFGLSVTPKGQHVWLDRPKGPYTWPLPWHTPTRSP